jgi:protein TonB
MLTDLPDEKKPEPLPEPERKPEEPQVQTQKLTPPEIVPDEDVTEPLASQEDLINSEIGVKTTEGIPDDGTVKGPQDIGDKSGIIGPFTSVEIDAKFNGNWKAFLERNLNANIPVDNNAPPGRYSVIIQFVVDVEGNVSDIKPLTEHGFGMEAEAVRAIKKATKWEPAFQNGVHVKAYKRQVIVFDISDSE